MSRSSRWLSGAAVTLALLLAAMAGAAAASEMTVSPAGNITMPSEGKLSFTGGVFTIRCNATLSGSLLAGPIRTEGTGQVGSISEVRMTECEGGSVGGALIESPWPITLVRMLGTAPNSITGELTALAWNISFSVFGEAVNCLYRGVVGWLHSWGTTRTPGEYTTGGTVMLATTVTLIRGGFLCPGSGFFSGFLRMTAQRIRVL